MKTLSVRSFPLVAFALIAGCSRVDAPTALSEPATEPVRIAAVQTPQSDFFWGWDKGDFTIVMDPRKTNVITWGEHSMTITANSICDDKSSYGPSEWNKPCEIETDSVTFRITSTETVVGHPRVDILPHVRFAPQRAAILKLFDPDATLGKDFEIFWCPSAEQSAWLPLNGGCIDEGQNDPSVRTIREPGSGYLQRRVKHFSGYEVAAT